MAAPCGRSDQEEGNSMNYPDLTTAGQHEAPVIHNVLRLPKELLSFQIGHEEYGIDILRVQEIRRYEAPTRIANAPAFIKGVVNLRGVIVPVIDLRLKLNCPTAEYTGFTVVIVLNVQSRVIGVVVDSVSDVIELDAASVKPAPAMSTNVEASYIVGIACQTTDDHDRMLILMDIEALLCGADIGLMESPTVH